MSTRRISIRFGTRDKRIAVRLFAQDDAGPGATVEVAAGLRVTYDDAHMVKGFADPDTWVLGVQFAFGLQGALGVSLIADWLIAKLNETDVNEVEIDGHSTPLTKADLESAISTALSASSDSPTSPTPKPPVRRRHTHDSGADSADTPENIRKRRKRRGRH